MRSMIPRGDPISFWFSTPFDDPIEAANNPFGWQRKIDLDAQTLVVKVPSRDIATHCPDGQ
jgi:hypothetical protein